MRSRAVTLFLCFRAVAAVDYTVTTLAGGGALGNTSGANDGVGTNALFNGPHGVAVDTSSNVYVVDYTFSKVRMITPIGVVTTLAGGGAGGTSSGSNNGVGTNALFNSLKGVAVDTSGNVYVADRVNHKVRIITPVGVVTTLAGGGALGKDRKSVV